MTGNIVVVDDSPEDAARLVRCLREAGICNHVKVCGGGDEALAYLFSGYADPPALLVTELHMPWTDGFELLGRVKNHCMLRDMIALVLTRSTRYADLRRAYELGADYCLTKPPPGEDFAELVKTFRTSGLLEHPMPRTRARCKVALTA